MKTQKEIGIPRTLGALIRSLFAPSRLLHSSYLASGIVRMSPGILNQPDFSVIDMMKLLHLFKCARCFHSCVVSLPLTVSSLDAQLHRISRIACDQVHSCKEHTVHQVTPYLQTGFLNALESNSAVFRCEDVDWYSHFHCLLTWKIHRC